MKRKVNGSRVWTGVILTVLLVGFLCFGWRVVSLRSIASQGIPVRPSLDHLPDQLTDELAKREIAARGFLSSKTGLIALSRLYHANGFYNEAMQCYEALQRIEPQEARWPHLHASVLAEFGRLEEALPLRRRAVTLAPFYIPGRLRLGDVLLKDNQTTAAAEAYTAVLAQEAESPYALLGLARCAIIDGQWTQAREYLQRAIKFHPKFYGALTLLVTVNEHLGDRAEADAVRLLLGKQEFVDLSDPWLDDLADDCYDPYRLSVMAAVATSAGDLASARRQLERAIALAPGIGTYHRQLALLLTRQGDLAQARKHLESALGSTPDDADCWLLLVQNMNAMGEAENAAQTLAKGLAACPLSPSLHLERGRWLNRAGRKQEAIAEYRESYRLRPSEASPLVELASVYFSIDQVEAASQALLEALRRQPDHPIAMTTLALIAISQGDESGARSWWSRVRRLSNAPPQAMDAIRQGFEQQFGRSLP